jgi:hypothetical protein
MMVVLQGRAEARQKMFNHLKQKGDMTQVRKGVTKPWRLERFYTVEEFEKAMMK